MKNKNNENNRKIRYKVTLMNEERQRLMQIIKIGEQKARKVRNSLILLNCDEGEYQNEKKPADKMIAQILNVGVTTVERVRKTFVEEGLEVVLNGKPSNRVYTRKLDGEGEARLIALCCSDPPEGFSRWTLNLLADKMVELKYVDEISYETVRRTLKKTN
jgi:transposase